jgi:hypothetical protein
MINGAITTGAITTVEPDDDNSIDLGDLMLHAFLHIMLKWSNVLSTTDAFPPHWHHSVTNVLLVCWCCHLPPEPTASPQNLKSFFSRVRA